MIARYLTVLLALAASVHPALLPAQLPTPTPENYVCRWDLGYSTYLGGSSDDDGVDLAVDSMGCAHVIGYTYSGDFPAENAYQSSLASSQDAFVSKFSSDGSTLVYSTYLGGSGNYSIGYGIDLDSAGNAFICGYSQASNFPVVSAYQTSLAGGSDCFAAVLSSTGSSLIYSTYLGGDSYDYAYDVKADSAGCAYIAGNAYSNNFPTVNAYQSSNAYGSGYNFTLTKLSSTGSALVYSTYLGGSGAGHEDTRVAVDSLGQAYLSGSTTSVDYPTLNPYQASTNGPVPTSWDVVLTKFAAAGSSLVFSTYLGGAENLEHAFNLSLDADGSVYLCGMTQSDDFPTVNPYQPVRRGSSDFFVARFGTSGSDLLYSTYLGGGALDNANAVDVDPEGAAWIAGLSQSTDFPLRDAYQTSSAGASDAVLARLSSSGSALLFCSYLGGGGNDYGRGLALDADGKAYLTGRTESGEFPVANPYQPSFGGGSSDVFLSKIYLNCYYTTPSPSPTPEGYKTPTASPTPTPSPTASPTATPSPSPSLTPTPSPSATPSPEPSATPSITPTPFGYKTPTPTPSAPPTPTVPPTPLPVPTGNWADWTQVNIDGFGDPRNQSPFSLACYNGAVYSGTWNNQSGCEIWRRDGPGTSDWTLLTDGGFGSKDSRGAYSMAVFDGHLFVGISNYLAGFQVWSYDGSSWTQRATGGLGNIGNSDPTSMAVHDGKLYMGTGWRGAVFAYDGSAWTQVNVDYFGNANNEQVRSLASHDGKVYAGVYNETDYASLYRYDGPGTSDWTLVTSGGFGGNFEDFRSLASFGGRLFIGTAGWNIPCQVWEYAGGQFTRSDSDSDGMQWDAARCMEIFDGRLYVGTGNDSGTPNGGQVWEYGWSAWSQVNAYGFGDTAYDAVHSLAGCYPALFAGAANGSSRLNGKVYMRRLITPTPTAAPTATPSLTPTPLTPTPTPLTPTPPPPTPAATASPLAPTPAPTVAAASPTPTCGPIVSMNRAVIASGDYNGDGTADVAVFRPSSGLWSIRNVSSVYYGLASDAASPGDYNGDGTADVALFRPASGQWFVRNFTRLTYGQNGDIPVPADYDGAPGAEMALFRPSTGRWYVRNITSVVFGANGDWPVPADYDAGGSALFAVYRPSAGFWSVSGLTRFYLGNSLDWPAALDYNGDGAYEPVVFRPCEGMWSIRLVTRHYLGLCTDWPRPADYNGDGIDDLGVFRDTSGMWAVRDVTRVYLGATGDVPATR